jgi:hypothetical protein
VEIAKVVKEVRRLLADPDCLEEDRDKDVGRIKKRGLHHGRASKLAEPARLKNTSTSRQRGAHASSSL